MDTIITITQVLIVLIALLLTIAFFKRRNYYVSREIIVNLSEQKVFDYLKQLKNQDSFNKWVMVEPDMQKTFKGIDGTIGFIYGWNGKKAGEGEQEIKMLEENKRIQTEIRFERPFKAIGHVNFIVEHISENQTKVIWSNESRMKYPINLMIGTIEKMLAKDMDTSLSTLKKLLEK